MATRLYTSIVNPAAVTNIALDAGWEDVTTMTIRDLKLVKANGAMTTSASKQGTGVVNGDVALMQFVSDPLAPQTITGTFKGQMRAREGVVADDQRAQCIVRVIGPTGTVRGTLVPMDAGILSSEFPITTAANRKFPIAAVSPVTCTSVGALAGDRVVIEVGFRNHSTTVTAGGTFVRFGDPTSADLPEDETTTTDSAPWFEFSQNLIFQPLPYRAPMAQMVVQ